MFIVATELLGSQYILFPKLAHLRVSARDKIAQKSPGNEIVSTLLMFPNWLVQVIYALFLFQTSTLLTENNSDCCDIGASNIICRLPVVSYCEFLNDSWSCPGQRVSILRHFLCSDSS